MGFAKADTGGSRASVSAPNPVYGAGRARAMCDVSGSTRPARSRFAIKLAIFASLSAKAVGACGSVFQGRLQASRRTLPQRPLVTLIGKYPLSACLSTVFLPSSSSSRAYNTRSRLVAWHRAINGGGATRWLKHRAAPKPQLEASHAAIYAQISRHNHFARRDWFSALILHAWRPKSTSGIQNVTSGSAEASPGSMSGRSHCGVYTRLDHTFDQAERKPDARASRNVNIDYAAQADLRSVQKIPRLTSPHRAH